MFGLTPALRQTAALTSFRFVPPSRGGLRSFLVALQIALSVVLLTAAGLLLRTLWNLEGTRLGMEPERVVTARFVLGKQRFGANPQLQVDFFRDLELRLNSGPGVSAAAITDSLPPTGGTRGRPYSTIEVEGRASVPQGSGGIVVWRYVSPGYFSALGIPILQGRGFDSTDRTREANAIILNETLAKKMFPAGDALGRRLLKTPEGLWHTVIGIAADTRNRGLDHAPDPEFYVVRKPMLDSTFANAEPPSGWRSGVALVRTSLAPRLAAEQLRETLHQMEPSLPVVIETMNERLSGVTMRPRFHAWVLAAFAAIGLGLAAIGLFGVLAYLVAQRQREMGLRLALGATPRDLVFLVLGRACRWIAAGLASGLAAAWATSRLLRSLLTGVQPADPGVWSVVALTVCLVGVAAAALPAWRASLANPASTLRQEQ